MAPRRLREIQTMAGRSPTPHISRETLARYVAMSLTARDERAVEEHVAECSMCTLDARDAGDAYAFEALLQSWTPEAHAAAYLQAELAGALDQLVPAATESVGARLDRWRTLWTGQAEAAVRVIMAASQAATQVVTEGLEALTQPMAGLTPAPVGVRTRGRVTRTRGQPAQPADPQRPPERPPRQVSVSADAERRRILVTLTGGEASNPPLVLLIPTSGSGTPRVQQLMVSRSRRPGLVASFDGVDPSDYLVVVEPVG